MGLLTPAELKSAIVSEFNPISVGFKGGSEPLSINNVLNIGVCPKTLIATLRARFEVLGGAIYEHTAFKSAVVGSDGVIVSLVNAAGAPADVGDTNRPNALQQEQEVHLNSPFGRVAGMGPVASLHHSSNSSSQHLHTTATSSSSSSSNGVHASHSHMSAHEHYSGSRYDRWVAAAEAAAGSSNGSNGAELAASGSNGSSTRHNGRSLPSSASEGPAQASQHSSSSSSGGGGSAHTALQSAGRPGDRTAAEPTPAQGGSRRAKSKLTCRLLLDCMGR